MLRTLGILLLTLMSYCSHANEIDAAREHIGAMEYTQAIAQLQTYLGKHKDDVDAKYLLARAYAWDNQYAQAEKIYNQLLGLEPDNTQYLFGKAQALIWQNKNAAAIPLLDAVIEHVPEQVDVWRLLILTLQMSRQPEDQQRAVLLGQQARARFPKLNWDVISN